MNTPKTHPLNVSYLVVGLVFLGIAGSWALRTSGVVDNADVQWLIPLSLVVAGLVGLVAFAAKGLAGRRDDEPVDEPAYDPYPSYDDPYPDTDPTTRLEDLTRGEDR